MAAALNSTHGKTGTQTLSGLPQSLKSKRFLNPSGGGDKLYYTYFEENTPTEIEKQGPRFMPGEHSYKTNLNHTAGAVGSVGKMQSYCYTRVGEDGKIYTFTRHGGWSVVGDDGNTPAQVYRQGLDDVSNTAGLDLLGLTENGTGIQDGSRGLGGGGEARELEELEDALAAESNRRQGLVGRVKAIQDSVNQPNLPSGQVGSGGMNSMNYGGNFTGSRGRVAQCSKFFQDERNYSAGDSDYARHNSHLKKLMSQPKKSPATTTNHPLRNGRGTQQSRQLNSSHGGNRGLATEMQQEGGGDAYEGGGQYYTNNELFPGKKLYITKHTMVEDGTRDELPSLVHSRAMHPSPPLGPNPDYYATTTTNQTMTTNGLGQSQSKKPAFKARSYEEFLAMQGPPPPIPVHKSFTFKCGGRQSSCAPSVNKVAAFAGGPGGSLGSNNYTRVGQDGQAYTYSRSQGWVGGDGEGGAGYNPGAGGGNTYSEEGYGGHTFQNNLISKVVRPH